MTESVNPVEMKITVVTPSFNQGAYIEETIDSVVHQRYPYLQYIVMDGGSTDTTSNILEKRTKDIHIWKSEKDNGQSHAINKGIKLADGEVFAWLNSDDRYPDGALNEVARLFQLHPDCHAVVGKVKCVGKGKEIVSPHHVVLESPEKTAGTGGMSQPAMFFKRELYKTIGGINESLHYCMDLEWWIRYLLKFGTSHVVTTNRILALFRLHEESKTSKQQEKFNTERNSIYYSLALQLGLQNQAKVIRATGTINESYSLHLPENYDLSIAVKTIHYFLLRRMDEAYYDFDYNLAISYSKEIDLKFLSDLDKLYFSKLLFRIKYVPRFIIRLLR